MNPVSIFTFAAMATAFGIFSVRNTLGKIRYVQISLCAVVGIFSFYHPYEVSRNIDKYMTEISWLKAIRVTNPDFVTGNSIGNFHLGIPQNFRAEEKKSVLLIVSNENKSNFLLLGSLVASGNKSLMLEMDGQFVEIDKDKIYTAKNLSHVMERAKIDTVMIVSFAIFFIFIVLVTSRIFFIHQDSDPFTSYRKWVSICNFIEPIQYIFAASSFGFSVTSVYIYAIGVSMRNEILWILPWSPVAASIFCLILYTRTLFQFEIVEHETFLGALKFLKSPNREFAVVNESTSPNRLLPEVSIEMDIFTHKIINQIKESCVLRANIKSTLLFLGMRLLPGDAGYIDGESKKSTHWKQSHSENRKILTTIMVLIEFGYLEIVDEYRFELTAEGLEAQALPAMLFVQQIPRKFQYQLAQARNLLNKGDYSAALGKCNREIFEPFLRFFLSQHGDNEVRKFIDEINKGRKGEKIQTLSQATAGQLKDRVASYLKIIQDKDVKTKTMGLLDALMGLMSTINDIRNESSHFRDISESEKRVKEGENAMFQIELLRIFMHITCTRVIDHRQVNHVEKLAEDHHSEQ